MRLFICIGQPAGYLIDLDVFRICCKREWNNPFIPFLLLHFTEINASFIDTRRCSCLKPVHFDSQFFQTVCQIVCRLQTIWPRLHTDISIDAPCLQIRSGTQYHCPAAIGSSGICSHTCNNLLSICLIFCQDFCHFHLLDLQVFLFLKHTSHGFTVICLVCLRAQRMNGRTFGTVEHLRLNKRPIDDFSHFTAQCIYFFHKMSFGTSSDIRITRHQRNAVHTYCKHQCLKSHSCTRKCSLASRMSGTYDHDIIFVFIFPYRIC